MKRLFILSSVVLWVSV